MTPGMPVTWLFVRRGCLQFVDAVVVMRYPQKIGIAVRIEGTNRWTPKVVLPSSLRERKEEN